MRLVIDLAAGYLTEVDSGYLEKCEIISEEKIGDTYFIEANPTITINISFQYRPQKSFHFSIHKNFWEAFKRDKRINQLIHPISNL